MSKPIREFTVEGRRATVERGFMPQGGNFVEYDRDTVRVQDDAGVWRIAGTTPAGDTGEQDGLVHYWATALRNLLRG